MYDPVALLPYTTTEKQREKLQAIIDHGSCAEAARALGLEPHTVRAFLSNLRHRAARKGFDPSTNHTQPVPPGYALKGTSTLYDNEGRLRLQWVKTHADIAEQMEALQTAVEELFQDVPRAEPRKMPKHCSKSMFTLYPEGDPHWGMKVWGAETNGENYDLQIALKEYYAAVDFLVDSAPATQVGIALNVGDNFHADGPENVTRRSGNHLQVDGRLAKVFATVIEARRHKIDRMLDKHEKVIVREVLGNHDEVLGMGFTQALKGYYHNEPRVEIHDSPNHFWYYRQGSVLLGATHGDRTKIAQMPLLMATDVPELWGATKFRHIYTGHQHHLERWEEPGAIVEMLRTLAARNEFEHSHGYRSGRDMKCVTYHQDYGEIFTIRMGSELVHCFLDDKV